VPAERRKVVTVVFADVVGSTALGERVDAETLHWAMRRWFDAARGVLERHDATVEKFIGDAVVAVFGVPAVHDDDALRAVRAAIDLRAAADALRTQVRRERGIDIAVSIGVNTGEAVTGDPAAGGGFATGDGVNVAARLEQAAGPGEILIGADTFRLVRHAVEAEPVTPPPAKRRAPALQAFRLATVAAGASARPSRPRARMVGRERERRRVLDAFHQAAADRTCQLFTVLGAPGVGKSRLVAEVLETLGDRATTARGRCLPHGDGLTWWPLAEALRDGGLLEQVADDDAPAVARVAALLEPAGEPVAPEEAFWAVRKVLEALARRRPLVLVIDDLQWAEPTFVDLVEHVAEWSREAPLLLLAMARPELLEERPGWSGGMLNATTVLLEPLARDDAADLLRQLAGPARLGDRAAARILEVADGNPLFVEEVVAMLVDDGVLPSAGGAPATVADVTAIAVPPTVQALLAERLDRLGPGERTVLEAASIEGKEFAREHVEALIGQTAGAELRALVRKDLIRPVAGADGVFRFRHQLIRDAAYDGMPKAMRAAWHERFADRLAMRASAMPVADELVGHHLERAVLLRRELGATDATTVPLAVRASTSLHAAGRRAADRADPASVRLLERALALAADDHRAAILADLAKALASIGELRRSAAIAAEAVELARAIGDRRSAARAGVVQLQVALNRSQGRVEVASFEAAAHALVGELESLDDDEGMASALLLLGDINEGRSDQASAYLERALAAAERSGNRKDAALAAGTLGLLTAFGPVAAGEGVERCRSLRRRVADHPVTAAGLLRYEAMLQAMQARIDEARALHAEADRMIADLGNRWASANTVFSRSTLELLAGAPERAEAAARASLHELEEMDALGHASTAAALLAVALAEQGNDEEALRYADLAAGWAAPDIASQVGQLQARALALAARGELPRAEAAARDAVRLSERSDELSQRGDALLYLAIVLDRAGRAEEAVAALDRAIALYDRKGNVVSARRAREMVERVGRQAGVTGA
jgi:predicted ATPase/class 3 adenylate cyclase